MQLLIKDSGLLCTISKGAENHEELSKSTSHLQVGWTPGEALQTMYSTTVLKLVSLLFDLADNAFSSYWQVAFVAPAYMLHMKLTTLPNYNALTHSPSPSSLEHYDLSHTNLINKGTHNTDLCQIQPVGRQLGTSGCQS